MSKIIPFPLQPSRNAKVKRLLKMVEALLNDKLIDRAIKHADDVAAIRRRIKANPE